jgi:hypothetical protein
MSGNHEVMGTQGWRQFLTNRTEMLTSFDKARVHSAADEVETDHGRVAEAEFRKWLEEFLPKRFAVTSGYILSQGKSERDKLPHYDVIIYDQLESPVLWIKDNPDQSQAGLSKAIPCEYVNAVIEVKSTLDSTTASMVADHLYDLETLLSDVDNSAAKYKRYLPEDVVLLAVFFECRLQNPKEALNKLNRLIRLRGYMGGIVLRGTNQFADIAGQLNVVLPWPPEIAKPYEPDIVQSDPVDMDKKSVSHGKPHKTKNTRRLSTSLRWPFLADLDPRNVSDLTHKCILPTALFQMKKGIHNCSDPIR